MYIKFLLIEALTLESSVAEGGQGVSSRLYQAPVVEKLKKNDALPVPQPLVPPYRGCVLRQNDNFRIVAGVGTEARGVRTEGFVPTVF